MTFALTELPIVRSDGPRFAPDCRVRATSLALPPTLSFTRDRDRIALRLRQELGTKGLVAFGEQVHGGEIAEAVGNEPGAESGWLLMPGADAVVVPGGGAIAVARTADCVPILVASAESPWVAAVHAGWRGTLARLLEKTIDAAVASGLSPGRLSLWVGPHIGEEVFEVSPELAATFGREFAPLGFRPAGRHLDLGRLNVLQAVARGVPADRIGVSGRCTFRSDGELPSYRRDGRCRGQIYSAICASV
ncbi:MAG: polyphenol oxidase family protein [Candidatus Sumerlaeia bacterium]|nr:polyphenol oxidase family protein [Candidatus Sumerlaeia bacterium]